MNRPLTILPTGMHRTGVITCRSNIDALQLKAFLEYLQKIGNQDLVMSIIRTYGESSDWVVDYDNA